MTVGVVCLIFFLLLLAFGVQIAIGLLITGFLGTAFVIGISPALSLLGETLYYAIATPSFAALPLFIIMGSLGARGGFAKKAFDGLHKFALGLPGSLAIATCFGCAAFGAISGSSLATAAIFGKIALPEMERYRYKKALSLGSIAAAGTFAAMIPPSTLFIVYAIFTDQSVGKLFMAGVIPGIITAIVYSLSIIIRVKQNPSLAPMTREGVHEKLKLGDRIRSLGQTWSIALIAIIVLGGIYSGLFTPTEAAAVGCVVTLVLGIQQGGIRSMGTLREALRESARASSMVFIIIIAALFFTRFLAITQIPVRLASAAQTWDVPRFVILSGIIGVWFLLGMFIIPAGMFALTLPLVYPLILTLNYDPIWFGVIALKMSEIAAVTPPVGLNIYALKGVVGPDTPIEEIFAAIWPFVLCDILVLLLLILFPNIALFLPNLM